jgi:hypothetical protein
MLIKWPKRYCHLGRVWSQIAGTLELVWSVAVESAAGYLTQLSAESLNVNLAGNRSTNMP